MSRRRMVAVGVELPSEVQVVRKPDGRVYYYWAPNRGARSKGARLKLHGDPTRQAFWDEIKRLSGSSPSAPPGSVAALVAAFRVSEEFQSLADSTRESYEVHMRRFANPDAWGHFRAKDLTPVGVQAGRNELRATPFMANQMLAVGRTIWDWGIPLGYVTINPFDKVDDLDVPDRGHIPWPAWVRAYVDEHAPGDLRRFARLGAMSGQRESDLIRFGPDHRERSGLWCRPKKTRKKRRAFFIPLTTAEALELDRWAKEPIQFENTRWKAPIERHRPDLYIYTPRGRPYTTDAIRSRWGRWLASPKGKALCKKWKEWLTIQVARYGWDIDPEEVRGPTLHGLRGSAVLMRRQLGYEAQAIANDIGMSFQMVEHYTRFIDQMETAEANARRFEVVGGTGA